MRSDAATVDDYLADLPTDRRMALETVRETILANLAPGFAAAMNWGMITYEVPLATHPDTYNGKPLMYAGLASQKNHMAVYLSAPYTSEAGLEAFRAEYRETGKPLDMGKSCVRFKRIEDLPLDVIGRSIAAHGVDSFVATYEAARGRR